MAGVFFVKSRGVNSVGTGRYLSLLNVSGYKLVYLIIWACKSPIIRNNEDCLIARHFNWFTLRTKRLKQCPEGAKH